jgi:hypothetical protein
MIECIAFVRSLGDNPVIVGCAREDEKDDAGMDDFLPRAHHGRSQSGVHIIRQILTRGWKEDEPDKKCPADHDDRRADVQDSRQRVQNENRIHGVSLNGWFSSFAD